MEDAYINGLRVQCESLEDGFSKAVAKYEFPLRDGALLDDMGQKARTVRLRCYFFGGTYEAHTTLLAMLYDRQAFEMEHPVYGLTKGSVETVSVRHDDRERTAEIDIAFVEGGLDKAVSVRTAPANTETDYVSGVSSARDDYTNSIGTALGASAGAVLAQEIDPATDILKQYSGLGSKAREYVRVVDTAVRQIEATISSVATPANALVSTIEFAEDLPGRVIGAVANVAARYSELFDTLKDAPERFIQSFSDAMNGLINELSGGSDGDRVTGAEATAAADDVAHAARTVATLEAGLQAGYLFEADEQQRQALRRIEGAAAFDAGGRYLNPDPAGTVMTVGEIETVLYTVRKMASGAIEDRRPGGELKTMVDRLTAHVNEVKLERDRIISVALDSTLPLHLVCLIHGMDYHAAERLLAINTVPQPNFTTGSINVYG